MRNDRVEPLRIGVLGAARISELAIVKPAQAHRDAPGCGRRPRPGAGRGVRRPARGRVRGATPIRTFSITPTWRPSTTRWPTACTRRGTPPRCGPASTSSPRSPPRATRRRPKGSGSSRQRTGPQFFEGFHYLYHPNVARLHDILASGELGELRSVESILDMPAPDAADPRWSFDLAGGALMDLGCYALHSHRALAPLAGGEPVIVEVRGGERAEAPGVDEWMTATLRFPNGVVGTASCNMAAPELSDESSGGRQRRRGAHSGLRQPAPRRSAAGNDLRRHPDGARRRSIVIHLSARGVHDRRPNRSTRADRRGRCGAHHGARRSVLPGRGFAAAPEQCSRRPG